MCDSDFIEQAGDCPKCGRPCEGYRIIPPSFLVAIICKPCETITLITRGYSMVASLDWWAKLSAKLSVMTHRVS